ncbi:MAG TPA: tRNA lysidine(34) synthetase TilS [Sphingomicrobium sp.]|nr:tRNA lysidine(34) synthetase TilS [Sphingomicrobium sp.]
MTDSEFRLDPGLLDRFRVDLDALIDPSARIGIAVSGGPDSLALLLLVAEVRPSGIEAATVDHALRPGSRVEAETVARICDRLGVPHAILTADWPEKPKTAIQERARAMRYRLLGEWARERGLAALATGHHLDDQAETLLMRLARGAGVRGLAGMRPISRIPDGSIVLVRPLLGWKHAELEAVCAAAGIEPIRDPSNEDDQFERVRVRRTLGDTDWLDAAAVAASAANLADADEALDWAVVLEWTRSVSVADEAIAYRPSGTPPEIRRRIVRRAILALATEGEGELRGRELDQLLATLAAGRTGTLRGVLCSGGDAWRFAKAPPRRS